VFIIPIKKTNYYSNNNRCIQVSVPIEPILAMLKDNIVVAEIIDVLPVADELKEP